MSSKLDKFSRYVEGLQPVQRLNIARERLERTEGLTHQVICLTEQRRAYLQRIRGLDWRKDRFV